jgi:hypothetical protein
MVKRAACLTLLLLGGSGAILYGTLFHRMPVLVDKEIEVDVPTLPGLEASPAGPSGSHATLRPPRAGPPRSDHSRTDDGDPFRDPLPETAGPGDSENPFDRPPLPPAGLAVKRQKITCSEAQLEPEWVIVRDAAVGGIARLANGELKRTPGGGCPT